MSFPGIPNEATVSQRPTNRIGGDFLPPAVMLSTALANCQFASLTPEASPPISFARDCEALALVGRQAAAARSR